VSRSLNKVQLIGNLGADPEVRSTNNGSRVATLSVATSRQWTGKSGDKQEKTEWHRVEIYSDPLIGVAERFLRKGSKIYVEGQLETRKWQDQSGQDRYTTEVALRPFRSELTMLDGRGGGEGGGGSRDDFGGSQGGGGYDRGGPSGGSSGGSSGGAPGGSSGGGAMDDEIPF